MKSRLTAFIIDNQKLPVTFLDTQTVKEGVECDIYSFVADKTKDLAIIRVQPGFKTPSQKVISEKQTLEGYLEGEGRLKITDKTGKSTYYDFLPGNKNLPVSVHIGDTMQWKAAGDSMLTFYEICIPPYENGRFENQS